MPGRLVPVATPVEGARVAFVPAPLPPRSWEWPSELWPLLVEARTCLASLDGTGKHLPNPEILLRPLQNREAQLSSQLEGTITDPHQQVLFDADPRYPVSANDPANAFREVYNYRRALRLRLEESDGLPLSLRLIRQLHGMLMDGVRGSHFQAGEFRKTQNQIGKPPRFVPPPPQYLDETLDAFEKYLHAGNGLDPLVRSFLAHYQFETIHPFSDGNGRVGRLLLALTIAEWCGLSSQWLYMSAFFEKRKQEYMDLMLGISTQGKWTDWLKFCLEGVVSQARDTESRCEKLLNLHRDFHKRLRGGSVRLSTLVDSLFESPVVTITMVKRKFGVAYLTAKSDIQKLVQMGIVKELERTEIATYYCDPIYHIIFGDAETDGVS
jgi:Fic family protein